MSVGLPIMETVLTPLAKSVLINSILINFVRINDSSVSNRCSCLKENFDSGTTIIFDKEVNIIKIIKFLTDSGLSIKVVIETIKNEAKEQKGGFLGMFKWLQLDSNPQSISS